MTHVTLLSARPAWPVGRGNQCNQCLSEASPRPVRLNDRKMGPITRANSVFQATKCIAALWGRTCRASLSGSQPAGGWDGSWRTGHHPLHFIM